ncbi:MAG: phosphorylase [Haloarculaceae archaeon]
MPIHPDALVLPAFARSDYAGGPDAPDEIERWVSAYDFRETVDVPGLPGPLRYDPGPGVALTRTGIGKAAAASSMGGLLAADAVDLTDTIVASVGIAGCPPATGTLGSVFLADAVVDWDLKHRLDDDIRPLVWRTGDPVWALDPALVEPAASAAESVALEDSVSARGLRMRYDDHRSPSIGIGPTVCGDEVWHGETAAGQVEALCEFYDVDGFVTTEMEDAGTAMALSRAGLLDQYVSVRAVSNFDRPPAGMDPGESLGWIDLELGVENAFRAGHAVVEKFVDRG